MLLSLKDTNLPKEKKQASSYLFFKIKKKNTHTILDSLKVIVKNKTLQPQTLRCSYLSWAFPQLLLEASSNSALFLQLCQKEDKYYRLVWKSKVASHCQLTSHLVLALLERRFGSDSSANRRTNNVCKSKNLILNITIQIWAKVSYSIGGAECVIITVSYKLDQLCLCSLLFLGLLSWSSLHLVGGIQLPTHDFRLQKNI